MSSKGVGPEAFQAELDRLLAGPTAPHDSKQIREQVEVTGAFEWKVADSVNCAIIFALNVGNLILGKRGLCLGPQGIPAEHLHPKLDFSKALPATVGPKPKKAGPWNYVISLANGYELRVRPDEVGGKQVIRFGLKKAKRHASQ